INGRGDALAQWGPLEPAEDMEPAARVSLAPPLDTWRLLYYPSPTRQAGFMQRSARWSLALGWGGLALAVVGLAFYFYRESDREMRDAAQRVTFVTQVSHELKTPLTNIRLYAELLDQDLEEEEFDGPRRRVAIIVSEAQRLSRLIRNILTFSRQRRGKLSVHPVEMSLDAVVENMVEQFRPALASVDIDVELKLDAPEASKADPDTIDQIVANLLSNVEKYAADGGHVAISTHQDETTSSLVVTDRGPGIPPSHRDRIFQPFYRISDRLADGVTGTGIGLALSAELARKNGGELRLRPTAKGASFELVVQRA
ncbi:MAG: HAMP domain-containing sensor histidine kinase, partial [Myxococcota bacterium]